MKKIIALFIIIFSLLSLVSCSLPKTSDDGVFDITATIYPQYDFLKNITQGADNFSLSLMISGGADMHNYQPTADDVIKLSNADFVVYIGGASDEWIANTVKNGKAQSLALLDAVKAFTEETVEGMESDVDGDEEYDEHIWLSPKNAVSICRSICDRLCEIDYENVQIYTSNTEKYIEELKALDLLYEKTIDKSERDTLIFAGRFPLIYTCKDYGIKYYAAFPGCSTETNASFSRVTFLAERLKELASPCVIVIDNDDTAIAESIIQNSGCKAEIKRIITMQKAMDEADSYIGIMKKNLDVIKEALG